MPPVATPVPREIVPDEPELVVPELNLSDPLTPASPALDVRIVMAPLVLAMPWPVVMSTVPPVATVLSPLSTTIWPPTPLVPRPTVMDMAPPLPPVAVPDPREIDPDEPELDVPELNVSKPLTPLLPAFDDAIVIAPLVLAMP